MMNANGSAVPDTEAPTPRIEKMPAPIIPPMPMLTAATRPTWLEPACSAAAPRVPPTTRGIRTMRHRSARGPTAPSRVAAVPRPTPRHLLTAVDLLATAVFALEGALAGIIAGLDVFGVLVIGAVTATGGDRRRCSCWS